MVITERDVPQGVRIFNSRFIKEIKHPSTNKAFKKLRLIICKGARGFREDLKE